MKILPYENVIYFGDTARVPYGTKSSETIIKYAKQDMRFLVSKGVDVVLVACGTVSSIAINELRMHFDQPILGIIEAGAVSAVKNTKNGIVAVIGTSATIRSRAYEYQIKKIDNQIKVISVACPLFVPLVENGYIEPDNLVTNIVCEQYLEIVETSMADVLVLGCTHYPLIRQNIEYILPKVSQIDAGLESVKNLLNFKTQSGLNKNQGCRQNIEFYVSDATNEFITIASKYLNYPINADHVHGIDTESN